jgi:hypothetical protein
VVEAGAPLVGVLGVQDDCAPRVTEIGIEVTSGGVTEVKAAYPVHAPSDLPVAVTLPSSAGGQAQHAVTVTYQVRPATVGGAPTVVTSGPFTYSDGASGRIVYALPCTCIGVACPAGDTCEEQPAGSGHATCVRPAVCGDQICDQAEPVTCPDDCASSCSGDGVCDPGETCATCPLDCGACCGDGVCQPTETEAGCPADCGTGPDKPVCGDAACDPGEDCSSCAIDCCCSDPCCVAPGPCCGSVDPCCGSLDPCCGSADPCCGSADPCCGLSPDGAPCAAAGACCTGQCTAGHCGACLAETSACGADADCCGGHCTGGACGTSPPPLRVTRVVVNAANGVSTPAQAQQAQLFFLTDSQPVWDEAKSAVVAFPATGGNVELVFDFAGNLAWTGTVTGLRFDPFNCNASPACDTACFNVDYIEVRDINGAPVPGQSWSFNGAAMSPIPSPFLGWTLNGIAATWTDGNYFGGCVDPSVPPPAYGDIAIVASPVSVPTQL